MTTVIELFGWFLANPDSALTKMCTHSIDLPEPISIDVVCYAFGIDPPQYPVPAPRTETIIGPACIQVFEDQGPGFPRLLMIWYREAE